MRQFSPILKLTLSFFILTFITLISIFLYNYVNISKLGVGVPSFNNVHVYFFTSVLIYVKFLPYIMALSILYTFTTFSNTAGSIRISSILMYPISFIILIMLIFAFFNISLYTIFSNATIDYNIAENYSYYLNYKNKIKNELLDNALASNNYEEAYKELYSLLYYAPYDRSTVSLIKKIEQLKISSMTKSEKEEQALMESNLNLGIKYFSVGNYKDASTYFMNVLDVDKSHDLALYYLNRISIIEDNVYLYNSSITSSIEVYDELAYAISLYQNEDYMNAYDSIVKLYIEYPEQSEVKNYYALITDAVRKNNFFIADIESIEQAYMNTKAIKNGFDIIINNSLFLSVGDSVYSDNQYYLFDVLLTEYDESMKNKRSVFYKYAKINSITENRKEIILKGLYKADKKTYSIDDREFVDEIFINIKDSSLNILRYKSISYLEDKSVIDIINWKNDINNIGYSDNSTNAYILDKLLLPIYVLLVSIVIAYYSLRYRKTLTKKFHFVHRIFGLFGIILFTFILLLFFKLLTQVFSHIEDVYMASLMLGISFLFLTSIYMLQLARTNIDDN